MAVSAVSNAGAPLVELGVKSLLNPGQCSLCGARWRVKSFPSASMAVSVCADRTCQIAYAGLLDDATHAAFPEALVMAEASNGPVWAAGEEKGSPRRAF